MKKKIASIAALCLALATFAAVLTACGEENTTIPRYGEYFFYRDEALGGLVLEVPRSSSVASGALVLPEESWWYAETAEGEETEHAEALPVVAIASGAFEYNSKLTSVTLPEGLKQVGDRAFYSCTALTSVTINGTAVRIGKESFEYCSALSSVTGGSVAAVGERAFFACSSLGCFSAVDDNAVIGSRAFGYTGIESADDIGATGSNIAADAFGNAE
mgnify:FL=1